MPRPSDLMHRVEELIRQSGAEAVGIAVNGLDSGREFLLGERTQFHAASTMKVCVMMEVFRQAEQGTFALNDLLVVSNEFASLVDGSPFSLDSTEDSDPDLYTHLGREISVRELVERMIVASSNLATNLLVDLVTPAKIQEFMISLGGEGLEIWRGVEDGKAFEQGWNNMVSAFGLMQVLARLAKHEVVSREASSQMIEVLKRQRFNDGLPASLPDGTVVAHKTGWTQTVYHDAGIVYPALGKPYVVVVLTRGLSSEKEAAELVSKVSHLIYGFETQA